MPAGNQHGFDALREQVRDMQTELLKAMYNLSQGINLKVNDSIMNINPLRE